MASAGGRPSRQKMVSLGTSIVPPGHRPPSADTPGTSAHHYDIAGHSLTSRLCRVPGRRADHQAEGRRARPAIPRSMSFYETCVAPCCRNGPSGRRRLTGAEAFELEGMDPGYVDIDRFWLKGADSKGPESVPVAN